MINFIKTKNGEKYYCFNDLIGFYLKNNIIDEYEIIKISEFYLEKKKGLVIDIGANIGTYSIPLAKLFKKIKFKTFEIQKTVHNILNKNIKLNKLKNLNTFNVGLSDKKKSFFDIVPDYKKDKNIGTFSIDKLTRSDNYKVLNSSNKQLLNIDKLDNYNFKSIILIKIDVEGHELETLKGSKNTLIKNNRPLIIFEAWKRESLKKKNKKTFQFLKKLGYKILVINNNCMAFSKEDYRINFIKVFIKILQERDKFNPNQGVIYNLRQTCSSLKKYFIRVIK